MKFVTWYDVASLMRASVDVPVSWTAYASIAIDVVCVLIIVVWIVRRSKK
jgi:hypothetical protein